MRGHWTADRLPRSKGADPGFDRYGGYAQLDDADAARCPGVRANGTDLRGRPEARHFDLNATCARARPRPAGGPVRPRQPVTRPT